MIEEGRWMIVMVMIVAMTASSVLSHEATNPLHQQPEPHVHHMQQQQQPSGEASQDASEHRGAGRHQPPPRSMDRTSVHDEA